MTLNADLSFKDVDPRVRRAFRGIPDKVLLAPHVWLYKWTNRGLSDDSPMTPWWSFFESTRLPSGTVAEGFRVSEERAKRLGRSHRKFARARAAISDQFGNTMSTLLVIQMNLPVWGFAGQASGQREFVDDKREVHHVFLIGGAHQVWVPNLTARHVTSVPFTG